MKTKGRESGRQGRGKAGDKEVVKERRVNCCSDDSGKRSQDE